MDQKSAIHRHFLSCVMRPEYASYLEESFFTSMRAIHRALAMRDRHSVMCDTDIRAEVKRWLHCAGRGLSVSRCVGSEDACPFVRCNEEVKCEKDLSTFVRRFDGQPLSEIDPSLVILHRPFRHLFFADSFD